MKLSKFTKQIIAVVMAFALVLVSNCFMTGTANAAQLTWDQLTDGLGSATVTNTSTDSAYGASFVGFVTDESWGPDSKWQGQAIKQGIPVESGKDYKVSVDLTASAQKKVLIQTLCGSNDYTERTYTINSTKQHIDFNFHATASTVKVVVAFGSMSDAGTYDIYIEDMTVEEETGPVPSVLEWTEFTDGLGQATVANTSTETKFGATFTGFKTNTSWGGDSIWQGQAKKTNYPVENGKNYTISLDASSTPGKKFKVQVLCNGVYTQDTFDVSSNTHIDLPFAATASTIQFIIAFGANDASEIGTYDIEISNLSIDKAEEPSTEEPTTAENTCAQAAWTFVDDPGTTGWQYFVANADSTYEGGTSINDPLVINYGTYVEAADTCQARSPITGVVGGTSCEGSITVGNASEHNMQNVQASVYAVDTSTTPYTYTWYHASEEGAQTAPAGGSATFTFDYTAPDVGYIVYVIDTSYSPTAALTFSATHSGEEPTTVAPTTTAHTDPCTLGDWAFAGPNDTGWQYFVNGGATGSTYSGGTDISTPLVINYGTYVQAVDTCQARSPITAVVGGTSCEGSITVNNSSIYNMENVQAGVYAVDTSVTPYTYTWYHASEEGAQTAPAGGSATFTFDYTAPDTGYIVYVINTSYSPTAALTFSATHSGEEPTTAETTTEAPTDPCTLGDWAFAGPNDTGWQYFVNGGATGSTYSGGTDIDTPLEINYGTYVESADTCQARSPITEVIGGTTCVGSITVDNASAYTMENVKASVYAVDTSTTPYTYTWYANPTEGAQTVPAGGSATFNFNYTAPNIGYIVYVADTSYSPTGKLTFSATHNGAYDVTDYKATGTYPEKAGKIFAGWYTDITYGTPYTASTGAAYAKFIDEKVLDCKCQKKNDKTALRFVSTIDDCLDYTSVGFNFTGTYDGRDISHEKSVTKVYKTIVADGDTLTPSEAFANTDSAYFFTYSIRNMDPTISSTWTVTPFYVTPDGTKVYGTTKDYSM